MVTNKTIQSGYVLIHTGTSCSHFGKVMFGKHSVFICGLFFFIIFKTYHVVELHFRPERINKKKGL